MQRTIVETTYSDGPSEGFEDYGGVRVVLDCGHMKQWDGWFPVPIPKPDDLIECDACTVRAAT